MGCHMRRMKWLSAALAVGFVLAFAGSAAADPPATVPGGPCIEGDQNVSLSSLPSYEEVGRQLQVDRGDVARHRRGGERGPVGRGP